MSSNDTFTTLNPGQNGDVMDETAAQYGSPPTVRKRPRVVIGGDSNPAALVDPINTPPTGSEFAIPTRQVGTAATQQVGSSASATASVSASTSTVALLAANPIRLGATVFNDALSALYVRLGAGATTTDFTVKILPGGYYEVPFRWVGALSGIWDASGGNARVTELT